MSAPFQLLPELSAEDSDRLTASIKARGVEVPVIVDENGDIIDGHNRARIANELGIDYPKEVRTGLADHEKRLLAVDLNLARRHMTDAQKVLLGRAIEPDIAERSRIRQIESGKAHGLPPDGQMSTRGATRDEVAKTVGLGSGRTYERAKQVIEAVEAEPDGEQLVSNLQSGDWTLDDARTELKSRHKEEALAQAKQEQATSDRILSVVGDPNGNIARQKLRYAFADARSATHSKLLMLNPESVVSVIEPNDLRMVTLFITECRKWLDDLESRLGQGLRIVRKDA